MILKANVHDLEINYYNKTVEFKLTIQDELDNFLDECALVIEFQSSYLLTKQACNNAIKNILNDIKTNREIKATRPPANPDHIDFDDKSLEYNTDTDILTWK